ncbi:hypothetical protein LTR27_002422 [Elasticomyces elasticus]|nr:hypothetical protein LTR27_002422 [Elasticomyces elasticus]
MYRNYEAIQQHASARKLADLEQKVGEIYTKARTAFGVPGNTLTLSRSEKDDLRKFLFLMKYRGHSMYSRFNVGTTADYTGGDRDKLRSYMTEKGLETPRDVWIANLYAFLDIKIDAGHQWHQVIRQEAYEDDADLFIYHVGASYMAFCKPQSVDDEWLLTENVYSIFEGPNNERVQKYTEWHNFAPVSASLLIVLRSNFLPGGMVKPGAELRRRIYQDSLEAYANPETATSLLQDLPIAQSSNAYASVTSYTTISERTVACSRARILRELQPRF